MQHVITITDPLPWKTLDPWPLPAQAHLFPHVTLSSLTDRESAQHGGRAGAHTPLYTRGRRPQTPFPSVEYSPRLTHTHTTPTLTLTAPCIFSLSRPGAGARSRPSLAGRRGEEFGVRLPFTLPESAGAKQGAETVFPFSCRFSPLPPSVEHSIAHGVGKGKRGGGVS